MAIRTGAPWHGTHRSLGSMFAPRPPDPHSFAFFLLIGSLSAVGPASMDLYLSSLPKIAQQIHVPTSAAQLTISLYLVGSALGQVVFGQLADVAGRRPSLLAGLVLFTVASLACAEASTLPILCAGRLVQGVAGASGMAIGRTVVRDLFEVGESARYYSRLTLIYGLAPIIAPVIGAEILHLVDWHGIFFVLAGFSVLLLIATVCWFPETLPAHQRQPSGLRQMKTTFGTLLRDRRFAFCTATLGFTTGALLVFVSSATFVIEDGYGASPALFGLLYGINSAVLVAGNQLNARLLRRHSPTRMVAVGIGIMFSGSICVIVAVLTHASLALFDASWAWLLVSWGFVQGNVVALGLARFGSVAGAASALMGVAQYLAGAAAAPLAGLGGSTSATVPAIITLFCVLGAAWAFVMMVRADSYELPAVACGGIEVV